MRILNQGWLNIQEARELFAVFPQMGFDTIG